MKSRLFYPVHYMRTAKPVDCATRLAVLSDPTRWRVVEVLLQGPNHVTAINDQVRVSPNLLSHHLRVLREAGLITCSREGKIRRYALTQKIDRNKPDIELDLGCCCLRLPKQI